MTITTLTGSGFANVAMLVDDIVEKLTGIQKGQTIATGPQYMRPVYRYENGDPDGNIIILESTTLIDPFADDAGSGDPEFDPWRICFQVNEWSNRPMLGTGGNLVLDPIRTSNVWFATTSSGEDKVNEEYLKSVDAIQANVKSLGIYVGTPETLTTKDVDGTLYPIIAWRVSEPKKYGEERGWYIDNREGNRVLLMDYDIGYRGRDYIEPIGNTGAEWTNRFDPTPRKLKRTAQGWMPNPAITSSTISISSWSLQSANAFAANTYSANTFVSAGTSGLFKPPNLTQLTAQTPATNISNANVNLMVNYLTSTEEYWTNASKAISQCWEMPRHWDGPDTKDADQLFINKRIDFTPELALGRYGGSGLFNNPQYGKSLSYRLTLSDHGLFLGCWGPDPEENGRGFSWLLVQRPVDKRTGVVRGVDPESGLPYTDETAPASGIGNRPLFCVNSVNGKFWKFTVRERDSYIPGERKDATVNSEDSGAIINPYQQQSLTEDGEYVITFLNNLNSSRFKYSDELDMVGTVSSDVVGGGNDIDVSVYNERDDQGELSKRTYHAMWSSGSYGTKMRIMVVQEVPDPNTPVPPPGRGARVTVTVTAGVYSLTVENKGIDYRLKQKIKITGDKLGGESPANDLFMRIDAIDAQGGIDALVVSTGVGVGTGNFPSMKVMSQGIVSIKTGAVFAISKVANEYAIAAGSDGILNPGTGYEVGNQILVLGSLLGGVDSTNDATITVDSISEPDGTILSVSVTGTASDGTEVYSGITGTNI